MVFPFSKPNELIYCFSNQQNQVILPPPKTSWLCLRVSEPTPKLGLLGYLANLRHGLNHLRSSSALQTKGVFVLQHKIPPLEMPDQIKTVCHWIHIRGRSAVKTEPRSHHRHGLVDQTTSFEIFLFSAGAVKIFWESASLSYASRNLRPILRKMYLLSASSLPQTGVPWPSPAF